MIAKQFLLEECTNVRSLLESTLRFEYGSEGSSTFYEECNARLTAITAGLTAVDAADLDRIAVFSGALRELTQLICRIERSSISEYSWPFVEELKKISSAICTDNTLTNPNTPLPVFVLADGGLDTYRIHAEQRGVSYAVRHRLLTIVFPKTLKNFVLLHSILGHEIGHAIFRCSQHQQTLIQHVISQIRHPGGQFENEAATAAHLFSPARPAEVQFLPKITQANIFTEYCVWGAWVEEILCDLIGLTTFGPSFLAAEVSLLYSLDLKGVGASRGHPLVAWRVNLLRRACTILGYDRTPEGSEEFATAVADFWAFVDLAVKADPWFDILDDAALEKALQALLALFSAHPPTAYPVCDDGTLEMLVEQLSRQVPPVGFSISSDGEVACRDIDFRSILFAGWIAAKRQSKPLDFSVSNRLCQHAIMQQFAISRTQKVA